ncbi:Uma2 family endonuclease [Streptomyces sp. NPDC001380]|uniref:Uma2 family endonuclease n=1 Tax=Streptomyces sp. NPDC001380 TaxID=3364566 RepID=UPI003685C3BC
MTAEPLPQPKQSAVPDWLIPPEDGFTAEDFLRMAALPPHSELIDGSLVFVSPQRSFHSLAMYLLEHGLRRTVPEDLRVRREMSVVLGPRQCPEPDLLLVRAEAVGGSEETHYGAADVVLAAEVVSPDSETRDRERKPQLYAAAGIPHFWRVERSPEDGRPVVYVYERDPATRAYGLTGIHHDRLRLTVPFGIDVDLTGIDRL